MPSKIQYGSLVYWGAADGHLRDLDAIQRSALKLFQKPKQVDSPLPSLESRRQASLLQQAAMGLMCILLDGKGCGLLNELKPVFVDPIQPPPAIRVSARIAARTGGPPRHPNQLQHAPICHRAGLHSLETYKRWLRVRLPGIWTNLNHNVLLQQHIEEFMPIRKQLQNQI